MTALLLYLSYKCYAFTLNWDVLYYLKAAQDCCMFLFITALYVSYEYFYQAKNNGIEECAAVNKNGKSRIYGSMFAVVTLLLLFIFLLITVFCFAIAGFGGTTDAGYSLHIVTVTFLNVFLPGTIANLAGGLLALRLRRIGAYSLMALVIFIVSPVSNMIPGIATDSFGFNLWPAKWLFDKIFPPNQDWITDAQYGLSNETLRWNLALFWIFLILAVLFFTIAKKKTKQRLIVTALAVILSAANLYGYFRGGSEIILGPYPNSITRLDKEYYQEHPAKEKTADFTVAAYQMKLSIYRELEAEVTMEIGTPPKNNTYDFTLYHGYTISGITGQDGRSIDYTRAGDYLTVRSEQPLSYLTVCYRGFSPCLFSNNQAVLLPGCFPYYPMAGFYRLNAGGQGYIPVTNGFKSQYYVQVSHIKQLYSNLPEDFSKKNSFSGTSEAFSLLGGFMEKYKIGGSTVCALSVPGYGIPQIDDYYLQRLQKEIDTAEKKQHAKHHLSLQNKTIFQVDTMFANFAEYDIAVLFNDHIFLMAGYDGYLPEYAEMLVKQNTVS